MRLIGTLQGEEEACKFHLFLTREEIECSYNPSAFKNGLYELWVTHEDQISTAIHWLTEFRKNPNDFRFEARDCPMDTQGVAKDLKKNMSIRTKVVSNRPKMPITRFIVFLCIFFYMWNWYQMPKEAEKYILTPLMIDFYYDMPQGENKKELVRDFFAEDRVGNPTIWGGVYRIALKWPASKGELKAPMFEQIKHGQIWRLFTPALLHGNVLHILFNMLWLWMLGKQVEVRTKKWRYIALTLIIGASSNTFQYLMGGPFFLGYSGIICGLAGFIWMRQRLAPWEGYPLQKRECGFLAVFIIAMVGIQLVSFFLARFQLADFAMHINIGNTAHISGAITGMVLGRIPLLSKGGR